MCDKSRSGNPIGRFDRNLVETYRASDKKVTDAAASATGTTGTVQDTERSVEGKGPKPQV